MKAPAPTSKASSSSSDKNQPSKATSKASKQQPAQDPPQPPPPHRRQQTAPVPPPGQQQQQAANPNPLPNGPPAPIAIKNPTKSKLWSFTVVPPKLSLKHAKPNNRDTILERVVKCIMSSRNNNNIYSAWETTLLMPENISRPNYNYYHPNCFVITSGKSGPRSSTSSTNRQTATVDPAKFHLRGFKKIHDKDQTRLEIVRLRQSIHLATKNKTTTAIHQTYHVSHKCWTHDCQVLDHMSVEPQHVNESRNACKAAWDEFLRTGETTHVCVHENYPQCTKWQERRLNPQNFVKPNQSR